MNAILAAILALTPQPTAVMIHGAGAGGWEYEFWRAPFEQAGWRVSAPDLMPADAGLAATTVEDYVNQIVWHLEMLPPGPKVLVGASMGGLLALKVAERTEIAALVLVNSVPPAGVSTWHRPTEVGEIMRWKDGPMEDTRAAMPDSDEATIQWAQRGWRDESGAVVRALREGVEAERPECPVLVVIGTADGDIAPEASQALASWAGADVQSYEGMSHVGPLLSARAPEVAQAAAGWLRLRGLPD